MAKKKSTKQEEQVLCIHELESRAAQEPNFGKGIQLAGAFDLGAKAALDSRATVKTIEERDAHVTGNRAYEGMLVYVEADQKTYQLINNTWTVFGVSDEDLEGAKTQVVDNLTSTSTTAALSANQGKVLKDALDVQSGQLTVIDGKVDQALAGIEGLGTDLENTFNHIDGRLDVVEADVTTAKADITKLKTDVSKNTSDIAGLTTALEAEVDRATKAEKALDDKIIAEVGALEAADTALNNAISAVDTKAKANAAAIAQEVIDRKAGDATLQSAIDVVSAGLTKEVSDRKSEITRVEGLITGANADLTDEINALKAKDTEIEGKITAETTARTEADTALQGQVTGLDTRVTAVEDELAGLELTWDKVTNKPFTATGKSLKVTTGVLDVKIDDATLVSAEDGTIGVADGTFAPFLHNHDSAYASKSHELNEGIHLTSAEKTNVAKIPAMESDITALKSTVGAVSQHHIVMTKVEMLALENTRHGDVCHVIQEQKTYILDKEDVDGDGVNPEWIEISDFNSLVTVDWSIINNKPFTTVGEGLEVVGDAIKVVADGSTVEIKNGKISVVEGIFADANHTHDVSWEEVLNKPTLFVKSFTAEEFQDGEGADAGLVFLTVSHNKASSDLIVKAIGTDNMERLVGVEYVNDNTVKIWTDIKETLKVTAFSYNFGAANPTTHSAIVGKALAGQALVGRK